MAINNQKQKMKGCVLTTDCWRVIFRHVADFSEKKRLSTLCITLRRVFLDEQEVDRTTYEQKYKIFHIGSIYNTDYKLLNASRAFAMTMKTDYAQCFYLSKIHNPASLLACSVLLMTQTDSNSDWYMDTDLVARQTGCTEGFALWTLHVNDYDIVNAIIDTN